MLSFLIVAAVASASALNVSTSTEVVSAYTTYCPYPTIFVEGTKTYNVTAPTTLTVSDCPCTRTHTFSTATVTVCPSSSGSQSQVAGPVNNGASQSGSAPVVANSASKQGLSIAAAVGAVVIGQFL